MRVGWFAILLIAPAVLLAEACVSLDGLTSADDSARRGAEGESGAAGNAGNGNEGSAGAAGSSNAGGNGGSANGSGSGGGAGNGGNSGGASNGGTAGSANMDAGAIIDARADAEAMSPIPFDAAGFRCSTLPSPLFCTDFDDGNLLTGWNGLSLNNGTAQTTSLNYGSPPYSAKFTATGLTSVTLGSQVRKNFDGGAFAGFKLGFDVFIETASFETIVLFSMPFIGPTSTYYSLTLFYSALEGCQLRETIPVNGTTQSTFYTFGKMIPMNRWSHVDVQIGSVAGQSTIDVKVDGVPGLSRDLKLGTFAPPAYPQLQMGAVGIGTMSFFLDNVVVTR